MSEFSGHSRREPSWTAFIANSDVRNSNGRPRRQRMLGVNADKVAGATFAEVLVKRKEWLSTTMREEGIGEGVGCVYKRTG